MDDTIPSIVSLLQRSNNGHYATNDLLPPALPPDPKYQLRYSKVSRSKLAQTCAVLLPPSMESAEGVTREAWRPLTRTCVRIGRLLPRERVFARQHWIFEVQALSKVKRARAIRRVCAALFLGSAVGNALPGIEALKVIANSFSSTPHFPQSRRVGLCRSFDPYYYRVHLSFWLCTQPLLGFVEELSAAVFEFGAFQLHLHCAVRRQDPSCEPRQSLSALFHIDVHPRHQLFSLMLLFFAVHDADSFPIDFNKVCGVFELHSLLAMEVEEHLPCPKQQFYTYGVCTDLLTSLTLKLGDSRSPNFSRTFVECVLSVLVWEQLPMLQHLSIWWHHGGFVLKIGKLMLRLPGLRTLALRGLEIDEIDSCDPFYALEELSITNCEMPVERCLARTPNLSVFNVSGSKRHIVDASCFAALCRMPLLREIGLSCSLSSKCFSLSSLPLASGLRAVDLSMLNISEAGLDAIGKLPLLEALDISKCDRITNFYEVRHWHLRNLKRFWAAHTHIDKDALGAIVADAPFLSDLNLHNCKDVKSFSWLANARALTALDLSGTEINNLAFGDVSHLPLLEELNLCGCRQITKFRPLLNLASTIRTLDVSETKIDMVGLAAISQMNRMELW